MAFTRCLILGLGLAAAATSAAKADTIRSLFGDGTRQGCYKRIYTDAHFARHPEQRVKVIAFDFKPETDMTARQHYGPVGFGIAVIFRSREDGDGGATFYCKDVAGKIMCSGESDSGTLVVSRQGVDSIMLRVTRGLGFENSTKKGFVSMEDGPDDKVFVLRKADVNACNILR